MAINEQHLKIRKFYEEKLKKHFSENDFGSPGILDFMPKKYEIGAGCLRYDKKRPEIPLIGEPLDSNIDCSPGVPASVLSAFERHLWYAQHSLSSIAVYKIPVEQVTTFAICIHGFVDNGWDNGGDWIEIYNQEGTLIGSTVVPTDYEYLWRRWKWLNRPIQGDDFNHPAPERHKIALNMFRRGREIDTIASTTGFWRF